MLGHRRVAIIDDADYLRQESANCLLKTLEEPPPGAVLILIGTSRGRQLPTILSRTQVVRFSPLSEEEVTQLLRQQQIAPEEAALLAASSEGSLALASQYAQGQLAELRERLLPQLVPDRFCSVRLADELGQFINEAGKEAQFRRQRLRAILHLVTGYFRGQLRASCANGRGGKCLRHAAGKPRGRSARLPRSRPWRCSSGVSKPTGRWSAMPTRPRSWPVGSMIWRQPVEAIATIITGR